MKVVSPKIRERVILDVQRSLSSDRNTYSALSFRALLRERCAATARTGNVLWVVAFERSEPAAGHGQALDTVLEAISQHAELHDQVGVLDPQRVAVLIEASDQSRWRTLIAKVQQDPQLQKLIQREEIYFYSPNGRERPRHKGNNGHSGSGTTSPSGAVAKTMQSANDFSVQPLDPVLLVHPMPIWKRAIDVVAASVALVFFSPLFLLVAVLLKVTSKGSVFFRHKRFGHLGQSFHVWKFRTMRPEVDPRQHAAHVTELIKGRGQLDKINQPQQLIPFGRFLRSTAIDELPQLINVFCGEMSLVGPRPDVVPPSEYESWQQTRFLVVPGLTGLWQVSGKNKTTFERMMQLDVEYVRRRSLRLDLRILLKTGPTIFSQVAEELSKRWAKLT